MKIEWWKSPINGLFYWHIVARNGRIVSQSRGGEDGGYKQKATMLAIIRQVSGSFLWFS
jgi:uncharacterized protein YegP (UPF0339 family)